MLVILDHEKCRGADVAPLAYDTREAGSGKLQSLGSHHEDAGAVGTERARGLASKHIGATHERRDKEIDGVLIQLVRRADLFEAPLVDHGDTVAEVERLFLLVRHEHRRDPDALDDLTQLVARALAQRRVEVREGLVEH